MRYNICNTRTRKKGVNIMNITPKKMQLMQKLATARLTKDEMKIALTKAQENAQRRSERKAYV